MTAVTLLLLAVACLFNTAALFIYVCQTERGAASGSGERRDG